MVDLGKYKSHPDKELTVHTRGVLENALELANGLDLDLQALKLAAIFHDLGKMNQNFQDKLDPNKKVKGYSKHAYLSAYGFLRFCQTNKEFLLDIFYPEVLKEKVVCITGLIAHHHGNLPNFFPSLLNENECNILIEKFIRRRYNHPYLEFIQYFESGINPFELNEDERFIKHYFKALSTEKALKPLDYYLETQFSFACLIHGDKKDAGNVIVGRTDLEKFSESYVSKLESYLKTKEPNSDLNRLRTTIRLEAVKSIEIGLAAGKRVFSLTAPTGSGKTLMMLSLAGKILETRKQPLRVIYCIPFLSITEQVYAECELIFENNHLRRIDSKAENVDWQARQEDADENPDIAEELITMQFRDDTFDFPLIVTTFVRFFETLVSNRNSTLLKLPNFANSVFLIDEIQSLPPRLYSFFVAYLDAFCRKFNSYAIVSTATMPKFDLPSQSSVQELFSHFEVPYELLSNSYFRHPIFNRYLIKKRFEITEIKLLGNAIESETQSVLAILNTIEDTKILFQYLTKEKELEYVILLNTHFTPNDRKQKVADAKIDLKKKKLILISTQLIEAGVDISFPVVYRDFATTSSIIQSAGRCNREGLPEKGILYLTNLKKNDRSRARAIYRGEDSKLLDFTDIALKNSSFEETDLWDVQAEFFRLISDNLLFGDHKQKKPQVHIQFPKHLNEIAFETIGKFRLIDEDVFGEIFSCYVAKNDADDEFEKLSPLFEEVKKVTIEKPKNFKKIKLKKMALENQLKKMSGQILQVRIKPNETRPQFLDSFFDLHFVPHESYSSITGIKLGFENQLI